MSDHKHSLYATANTLSCDQKTPGVYLLAIEANSQSLPQPGQFYMLRAQKTGVLLSRPISVYRVVSKNFDVNADSTQSKNTSNSASPLVIEFLILKKGSGTAELCALEQGDELDILGPVGNTFPQPTESELLSKFGDAPKLAIVGGGIGIAPVAGFATSLPAKTYDFYAGFKTGSYGLDYIKAANLYVTTDDGSVGIKGMIPQVLTAKSIQENGYTAVYACGPEPLLAYVHQICGQANVQSWLSLESRMACGVGACLGCSIATKDGNKRCCKDGPVFDGSILQFPLAAPKKSVLSVGKAKNVSQIDLSCNIAGVSFINPVIAASGTFGYGTEYSDVFDVDKLGGICSKGLTLEPRSGNTGVRLHETPSGLINSIGLENPGIPHFIEHELPLMQSLNPVTIINLSGSSVETYVKGAELLDAAVKTADAIKSDGIEQKAKQTIIELNISCPNVKAGGMGFGLDPKIATQVTEAVRKVTTLPLMVKLTPNAPNLVAVAMAVRKAGADALSLVNTFQAMAIDVEKGIPIFDNVTAGLAGPAIRPLALRMVYDVCKAMRQLPQSEQIPVIGLGGIKTWQDAVEFIMAGATAIQVGTATFAEPDCMIKIIDGLTNYMQRKGFINLSDFRGCALQ